MDTKIPVEEYLAEVRAQVCSRCIERPPEGPPCLPQGRACAIELHLPALVEAVHDVHSALMGPYVERMHQKICPSCPFAGPGCCPCPGEYLLELAVEAIEAVDERHQTVSPVAG
jgi:hypothetical protein